MHAAVLLIVLCVQPAIAQLPGQEGFALPNPISFDDLVTIGRRIYEEHCQTPQCRGYDIAINAYVISSQSRSPGGQMWLGQPPSRQTLYRQGGARIDAVLNKNRAFWPEICDAITTIVEHDDFSGPFTTPISVWSLDIGRRITHPGLDCLGEVKKRIPPSEHRDVSMKEAYGYCIVEPHAQCGRLKP
jgi:hypothetical protein